MNRIEKQLNGQTIKRVGVEKLKCDQLYETVYNLEWIELENGKIFIVSHYDQTEDDGYCKIWKAK